MSIKQILESFDSNYKSELKKVDVINRKYGEFGEFFPGKKEKGIPMSNMRDFDKL